MVCSNESLTVANENDLVATRYKVRIYAKEAGLGLVDETKLITAASELTRNMLNYAGGGYVCIEHVTDTDTRGVRISFEDHGPGIVDLDLALTDGYSTVKSLGLGLPGARRLVDEFEIISKKGEGTRVVVTKWKR
ncbi:MAG TPA: anti-sigma regulatory factor [Oculatellaceae cyanobacterium]